MKDSLEDNREGLAKILLGTLRMNLPEGFCEGQGGRVHWRDALKDTEEK